MAKLNSKNQIRFNSIYEIGEHVEHLQANPDTDGEQLYGYASSDRWSDTGGLDLDEAIAVAKTGGHWQEGADLMPRVHVAHEKLNGQPILAPSLINNVQGFACNVPNYLSGLPDSMIDFEDDLQGEKLIKVGVSRWPRVVNRPSANYEQGRGYHGCARSTVKRRVQHRTNRSMA